MNEIDINIEKLNEKIRNTNKELNSLKGLEIISENLVFKIYDLFGRNALLSMLYQIGKGTGETVVSRIKEKYQKEKFTIEEAVQILLEELKDFYAVQIKDVKVSKNKVRITIENRCFLREPIKSRPKLKFGKAFCRINKGYFETAFKELTTIQKMEINFIENDEKRNLCIEELIFYL